MEIEKMTNEQLTERRTAIAAELETEGADLDSLEEEVRKINAEIEKRKAKAQKRKEIRRAVASGAGNTLYSSQDVRQAQTVEEIRRSRAYIDAFAEYVKTGDDKQCRALLTTNSNVESNPGQVPVPTIIEERVRTAWERNGLLQLVRRTYVRGNLQVGFELSATPAAVHAEGTDAPDEEVLTFGVVTLIPQSIKKWIRISDEALDMGGEEFLYYIYDEITYQIAKEARRLLIAAITGAPTANSATAIGVPAITGAPTLAIVAQAIANLSDEAENVSVVMNRLTHADFIAAMTAGGFLFDPFENVTVHYENSLPAYDTATAGQTWMIVGDFAGAQMNFPNGEDIRLKFDDLTESESDLVKIVGRMFAAIGITAPGRFVNVQKGN